MPNSDRPRLPPGRPPWETFTGIRVGGLAGAIVGVVVTLLIGTSGPWITIAGAVAGGAVGYGWAKSRQRMPER